MGKTKKCTSLNTDEVDRLFFPGSGGKPHKAEAFCADCPFQIECLEDAIKYDLEGFFGGMTKKSRDKLAEHLKLAKSKLEMPPEPEPHARPIYLKVFTSPDYHSWMDEVEPTMEELLQAV